jgi:hypothetical protein
MEKELAVLQDQGNATGELASNPAEHLTPLHGNYLKASTHITAALAYASCTGCKANAEFCAEFCVCLFGRVLTAASQRSSINAHTDDTMVLP